MRPRIIGMMMVKNEDIFIHGAIKSVIDFVDELHVIDTGSTDKTKDIVLDLQHRYGSERIWRHSEYRLDRTHELVEQYIGKDYWLFGCDGDEIYDAERLGWLRKQIMDGRFENAFQIRGRFIHVTELDTTARGFFVTGYKGPPSHAPSKLYNFAMVGAWPADWRHTLFHAKTLQVVPRAITELNTDCMVCYHMRFFRRSTIEKSHGARLTPEDIQGFGSRKDRGGSDKRNERLSYRQGPIEVEAVSEATWKNITGGIDAAGT